jgi:hypothetical protein
MHRNLVLKKPPNKHSTDPTGFRTMIGNNQTRYLFQTFSILLSCSSLPLKALEFFNGESNLPIDQLINKPVTLAKNATRNIRDFW